MRKLFFLLSALILVAAAGSSAYNGWPLYYYVHENKPGLILCQNVDEFGGL
jgi:predicted lipoprotein with Yx(FWY)xxD motif